MTETETLAYLNIDPQKLNSMTSKIDADTVGKYLELVVAKTKNHRIGLETGFILPFGVSGSFFNFFQNYSKIGELFEVSDDGFIPLDHLSKYTDNLSKGRSWTEGDYFYFEKYMDQDFVDKYPIGARQWNEIQIGVCLQFAHGYTGKRPYPAMAHSIYKKEGKKDKLEEYLNCPVLFEQEKLCLVFDKSILDWPIRTANKDFFSIYENLISETKNTKLSESINQYLLYNISNPDLSLHSIANDFNIGERSLQRKLKEEGTSYQLLINRIRKELAQKYIEEKRTFIEISTLLGFESQSAFNKFFRKHFNTKPSLYNSN